MHHKGKTRGVRQILLIGIFWRILFIEAVLLIGSLGFRWWTQDAGAADLFWYAIRILVLVAIIIAFMMITLKKFLTDKIIAPLEALAAANKRTQKNYSRVEDIPLPQDAADEIKSLVTTRTAMLEKIISVSEERLTLVNFIKETFGRYLSQKVVDEILTSPKGPQIGGSRKVVTVLISDLRGFTGLSENRDPEEMVRLLNRYLAEMSKIILKHDGIIDEILGDAILAVFGAPKSHDNDPERAVACAIEMQNGLDRLNREITLSGYPPIEMGIGINTGEVIVGNIGSELRMKYGIVGDTVNRASRIESNSVGGQVLIGQSTYDKVKNRVIAQPPRAIMMKGMQKPLVFYPITAIHTRNNDIRLHQTDRPGRRLPIRLEFQCWPIQGKKVSPIPIAGETLSMDTACIHVKTAARIPALTDVKLRINFCMDAHCFGDIYAKNLASEVIQGQHHSRFAITAMDAPDRALLDRWLAQIT